MDTRQLKPLKEETILSALYYIRSEIVRDDLEGLEHVDWLICARGGDPEARLIRQARPRRFKRRRLSAAVLATLKGGPMTAREIADRISNHPRTVESVGGALRRLRDRGMVVVVSPKRGSIKQVWRLA